MQHHHDGPAALAVEPGDQVEHLDLVGEVEVRGRLVEQQQVGVLGQRHRDPGPLALAAGELVERTVAQGARCRSSRAPPRRPARRRGDHWLNHLWCGWRPRPTRSRTSSPSGAVGLCGSRARAAARSRGSGATRSGRRRRAAPRPAVGLSSRARVRSSVDLPQPFGPTIEVTLPSGTSRVRSRTTGVPPYPTVTDSACESRAGVDGHAETFRLVAEQEPDEVRRADRGRHQAGGQGEGQDDAGDQVGADDEARRRGPSRRPRADGSRR